MYNYKSVIEPIILNNDDNDALTHYSKKGWAYAPFWFLSMNVSFTHSL